jgi:hypothetical protein
MDIKQQAVVDAQQTYPHTHTSMLLEADMSNELMTSSRSSAKAAITHTHTHTHTSMWLKADMISELNLEQTVLEASHNPHTSMLLEADMSSELMTPSRSCFKQS